jgi:hypothetical protein
MTLLILGGLVQENLKPELIDFSGNPLTSAGIPGRVAELGHSLNPSTGGIRMSIIYGYTYTDPTGNSYTGKIAADPAITKYDYQAGQSYAGPNGGTYKLDATGTQSSIPGGYSLLTNYTAAGKTYNSYVYDPKTNQYYTSTVAPYSGDWRYYPNPADATNYVDYATGKLGLGSEYGFIKSDDGTYHSFGRGGYDHTTVTPQTLQVYDYKFTFSDGSYYTGKVIDDGTYGYKAGYTQPGYTPTTGSYTITATEPASAVLPTYKAGEVYGTLYYDAIKNTNYQAQSLIPGTPYAGKAEGYGGLGTEVDWIKSADGYHKYGGGGNYEASTTPAVASIPVLSLPS